MNEWRFVYSRRRVKQNSTTVAKNLIQPQEDVYPQAPFLSLFPPSPFLSPFTFRAFDLSIGRETVALTSGDGCVCVRAWERLSLSGTPAGRKRNFVYLESRERLC